MAFLVVWFSAAFLPCLFWEHMFVLVLFTSICVLFIALLLQPKTRRAFSCVRLCPGNILKRVKELIIVERNV